MITPEKLFPLAITIALSHAALFDFNDGTVNIVANNLSVDVHYDDGAGNIGETGFFVPTDPKTLPQ